MLPRCSVSTCRWSLRPLASPATTTAHAGAAPLRSPWYSACGKPSPGPGPPLSCRWASQEAGSLDRQEGAPHTKRRRPADSDPTVQVLARELPGLSDDGPLLAAYIQHDGRLPSLTVDKIRRILEYTTILQTLPHLDIKVPPKLSLVRQLPYVLQLSGFTCDEDRTSLVDIITQLAEADNPRDVGTQTFVLDRIAPYVIQLLDEGALADRHVSLVCWAYGKKGLQPRSCKLWEALASHFITRLRSSDLGIADACRGLWGFSESRYCGSTDAVTSIEAVLHAFEEYMLSRLPDTSETRCDALSLLDIATIADAYVSCCVGSEQLFSHLAARAVEVCVPFQSQSSLAYIRRTMARRIQTSPELLAAVPTLELLEGRLSSEFIHSLGREDLVASEGLFTTEGDVRIPWWTIDHFKLPMWSAIQQNAESHSQPVALPAFGKSREKPITREREFLPRELTREPIARSIFDNERPPTARTPTERSSVYESEEREQVPAPPPHQSLRATTTAMPSTAAAPAPTAMHDSPLDDEDDASLRLTRGDARALNVIAHSFAALGVWHGPFFSVFKRMYPIFARKLEPRDTLRLLQTNLAIRMKSPFPNLALGSFSLHVDISDTTKPSDLFRHACAAVPSQSLLHHPRWRPFVLKMFRHQHYTTVSPQGCGVAIGGYGAFLDPMGRFVSAYVPSHRKRDQDVLAAVYQSITRIGSVLAEQLAAQPVPPSNAAALQDGDIHQGFSDEALLAWQRCSAEVQSTLKEGPIANFVSMEGLHFDFCFPRLRRAVKLVFSNAFSPRQDCMQSPVTLDQHLCFETGWVTAVIPGFNLKHNTTINTQLLDETVRKELHELINMYYVEQDLPPAFSPEGSAVPAVGQEQIVVASSSPEKQPPSRTGSSASKAVQAASRNKSRNRSFRKTAVME
jgi:hypothetical protein